MPSAQLSPHVPFAANAGARTRGARCSRPRSGVSGVLKCLHARTGTKVEMLCAGVNVVAVTAMSQQRER